MFRRKILPKLKKRFFYSCHLSPNKCLVIVIVGAMANRFGDVHCSQMEYSGVLEGSGIDLDVSAEVEVETQPLQDPGPPTASSTPAKVMPFLCSHCGKGY